VGPASCPAGFVRDASGFGCRDLLVSTACTGATREAIGSESCVPVGDCSAPFPPAGADLFVDPTFADNELDTRHFRDLVDALSWVSPGDLVAIAGGEHSASFSTDMTMTLVGRCPAEVALTTFAPRTSGVIVDGGGEVEVRGVTLRGHAYAGAVYDGGRLTLRQVVIEGNSIYGVTATDPGSVLHVVDSVIRDTVPDGDDWAPGALAHAGGHLILEETAVVGNRNAGVFVEGPGSAELIRSVVRGTLAGATGNDGLGIAVQDGGALVLTESVVAESHDTGVMVFDSGSRAELVRSVVRDTAPRPSGDHGRGVSLQDGGELVMSDSTLLANTQIGLWVAGSDSDGVASRAQVERSAVVGTRPDGQGDGSGRGVNLVRGTSARLVDCAVVGSREVGILASDPGTSLVISGGLVSGTLPNAGLDFGQGIACTDDAGLLLADAAVIDNYDVGIQVSLGCIGTVSRAIVRQTRAQQAEARTGMALLAGPRSRFDIATTLAEATEGIGLAFMGGSGVVRTTRIAQNRVGAHLQDGSTLRELDLPPPEIDALDVVVLSDTVFADNEVLFGSGVLPLPNPLSSYGD
jgi:hypothetical protein